MPSSIFNFKREIPGQRWNRLMLVTALLTLAGAAAWEIRCRAWGYAPTLNDSDDLWTDRRKAVLPASYVIIGDSRPYFDLDLDVLQRGLGGRPVQLAIPGSCAYPVLANLADDASFHGTVICSVVPGMFFAPGGPLVENSLTPIKRSQSQTVAQKYSNDLGMLLEEHIAFLKTGELDLGAWLARVPLRNRPSVMVGPALPPYFNSLDRERRARMFADCARPGPLQDRVKHGWPALFTPPPPPAGVPKEVFLQGMQEATEQRFRDTASAVQRIRSRGGKVVFVRFPMSNDLKTLEDTLTPRAGLWARLLKDTAAPGIYFEDYPELSSFTCPEWSHLSAADSVKFTERLVPLLRERLAAKSPIAESSAPGSAKI